MKPRNTTLIFSGSTNAAPASPKRSPLTLYLACCIAGIATLGGCVTESVRSAAAPPLATSQGIDEAHRLNINIGLFDANVPEDESVHEKRFIYPEIRNAEARYMPLQLAGALDESGNWGVVRVTPADASPQDVNVRGQIIESTGYRLVLKIEAHDASGRRWLKREYKQKPSKYAYHNKRREDVDPFKEIYVDIANDLAKHAARLKPKDIENLRETSRLRYARALAPDAYGDYLKRARGGRVAIAQLPAKDDPIMQRIDAMRVQEGALIDALQDHYLQFSDSVSLPYHRWRSETYQEIAELEKKKKHSRAALLAGIAGIIAGAAIADSNAGSTVAEVATQGALIAGTIGILSGITSATQANVHRDAVREISESLNSEVVDNVIRLEEKTVVLRGNAEGQFEQWRQLLREIHMTETIAGES